MSRRIAFVTCTNLPDLTSDDRLAVAALAQCGVSVVPAVWTDPAVDWTGFDAVVLRSTWDYYLMADEFAAWLATLERDGVPCWNPVPLVRWNADKRYLRDLEAAGIPVVPTRWIDGEETTSLARLLAEEGWNDAVLKPAVSAGAFGTRRVSRTNAALDQPHLEELAARGGAMVQPFLADIAVAGEWSLIFFRGEPSHAVRKRPRAGDFRVQAQFGGDAVLLDPPAEVLAAARTVMEAVDGPWLYARVDGVPTADGFRLMELEMIEPSLFLEESAEAPGRFAAAVLDVLAG